MKILVVGASGDIGSHLIPELSNKGYGVRALVKTPKEADKIRMPGVEIYFADITNPRTIDGAALGIGAVYHLDDSYCVVNPEEDLRKLIYEGLVNVADECINKGVKRFIFTSSPFVLGLCNGPLKPVSPEMATEQPNTFYALYKKLCEQHLTVLNKHGKLDVTILRLGTVYGPAVELIKTLRALIKHGVYRIPNNGENKMQAVHIEDVVQVLILVLKNKKAIGQIYNVADDRPILYKEFIFKLADLLNMPRPKFISIWVCRAIASLSTIFAKLTNSTPLINNDILTLSTSSFELDTLKTKVELGFSPKYPTINEGLPTCNGFYRKPQQSATA